MTTRRYHGLLVAALKARLGCALLVAKLEETAQYDGGEYALFADRWVDGTVSPQRQNHLERFRRHEEQRSKSNERGRVRT